MSRKRTGRQLWRTHVAEYTAWRMLRHRCLCKTAHMYGRYGGRGIKVCERWASFSCFLADMGTKPTAKHSIDRIDNDGDYTPRNCRWATAVEQSSNRCDNRLLDYRGRVATLAQHAREAGLDRSVLRGRLRIGWSLERALTEPCTGHRGGVVGRKKKT